MLDVDVEPVKSADFGGASPWSLVIGHWSLDIGDNSLVDSAKIIAWQAPASSWTAQTTGVVGAALPLLWVTTLFFARAYEQRFLWVGPDEFRRVAAGSVWVVAAIATVSWR